MQLLVLIQIINYKDFKILSYYVSNCYITILTRRQDIRRNPDIKKQQGTDPMSSGKITSHEPTLIKRDPNDKEIAKMNRLIILQNKQKSNIK